MPRKPLKPCGYYGCSGLAVDTYCEKHRKHSHQSYKRARTDMDGQAFYNSTRWRQLRAWQLKREPLCRMCNQEGRLTPADMVDHIKPIKQGGERLDITNLQSLCKACHNRKTANERSG